MKHDLFKTGRHKTLLTEFLNKKMAFYNARYELGFSEDKYKAALLTLTSIKQVDIAKMANTTHAVIRVWKTQSEFKMEAGLLHEEFEDLIREHIKESLQRCRGLVRKSRSSKGATAVTMPDFDELMDLHNYSNDLKTSIQSYLLPEVYIKTLETQDTENLSLEKVVAESIDIWYRRKIIQMLQIARYEKAFGRNLTRLKHAGKKYIKILLIKHKEELLAKLDDFSKMALFLIMNNYQEELGKE